MLEADTTDANLPVKHRQKKLFFLRVRGDGEHKGYKGYAVGKR